MWSGSIEVRHILIEHPLELLLIENQQVVKAFLPYTPQKAFADGIRSWSMIGRFENLDGTRGRHPSEARPKFAIVIPTGLAQTAWLPEAVAQLRDRWEMVSLPRGSRTST